MCFLRHNFFRARRTIQYLKVVNKVERMLMKRLSLILAFLVLGGCQPEALRVFTTDSDSSRAGCTTSDGLCEEDYRIFVSSSSSNSNLGGLAGADATCAALATAEGLTRNYIAILSTGAVDAIDRITGTGKVYMFVGASSYVQIKDSWANLWVDGPDVAVSYDETATVIGAPLSTHSGTTLAGVDNGSTCSDWGGTAGMTKYGAATAAGTTWIDSGVAGTMCVSAKRIYCISEDQ